MAALEFLIHDNSAHRFLLLSVDDAHRPYIVLLAVSTRPPDGVLLPPAALADRRDRRLRRLASLLEL